MEGGRWHGSEGVDSYVVTQSRELIICMHMHIAIISRKLSWVDARDEAVHHMLSA